jgi:nucleoside-diphosphate-sugar epimerase
MGGMMRNRPAAINPPCAERGQRLLDNYAGRSALVTGGASFIGSHLVEFLLHHGASVRIADDLSSGRLDHLANVSGDCETLIGDVRDMTFAEQITEGMDTVFHLAASHGGRGYIDTHPVECCNNLLLDHVVFSAAVKAGVERIVHASSACVYPTTLQNDSASRPLLTEASCNFEEPGCAFPDGEYGWAKLMGELQLRAFHRQFGIDAIACRIFTTYGERENESHAVIALIAKALAKLDPYPIWGDGTQTRNFTYVADTVRGMALAGIGLKGFDVINVGSPLHSTINELAEDIFDAVGFRPKSIDYQLDKPVGVKSRAADCTKCVDAFDWWPATSIKEGVPRTVEWYRETIPPDRLEKLEALLMSR